MIKWNSTAAKVIVASSLVVLFVVASTEAVMLAQMLRYSSEESSLPGAAKQTSKATAEQPSIPPSIPAETWTFHRSGSLGASHVPFRFVHGVIEITARINGKLTKCIVDTGCPIVFWVSWLHLTDQRTGLQSTIGDAGNHTGHTQEALLNDVKIGALELHYLPSYAVAASRLSSALPTLGNSAFAHTAMTIDYVKRELILQPSVSNTVPAGVQDRSHMLDFQWFNADARGAAGVPYVHAAVMSEPVNMTIDTGWLSGIGITRSFYSRLLPELKAHHIRVHKETINVVMGSTGATAISHVSWSLGGITQTSPALAINTITPGAQAVISPRLLDGFRVTIDYPQQKIWFDPISPASKPLSQAKQRMLIPQKV